MQTPHAQPFPCLLACTSPLTAAISSLAAGAYGTIALMDDGTVTRWGTWGFYNGDFPGVILLPERVPGVTGAKGVAAAVSACAALEDGTAKCWGDNFYGQLGE